MLLSLVITPVPDLLLIDEPISGVDQDSIETFYRMVSGLRERPHLLVIQVYYDLHQVARFADQLVFLILHVIVLGQTRQGLDRSASEAGLQLWR